MQKKIKTVIRPLIDSGISLKKQKQALHEMFAMAVSNAPQDELDNYSAKKLSPVYLCLVQMLENVSSYRRARKRKKARKQ